MGCRGPRRRPTLRASAVPSAPTSRVTQSRFRPAWMGDGRGLSGAGTGGAVRYARPPAARSVSLVASVHWPPVIDEAVLTKVLSTALK